MAQVQLVGGSAGMVAPEGGYDMLPRIPLFTKENLFPTFIKDKTPIKGVILPSFDTTLLQQDTSRPTSVASYRDLATKAPDGYPAFTPWFFQLGYKVLNQKTGKTFTTGGVYTYYGKAKSTFLSPSTFKGQSDPILDLRIEVFKMRKNGEHKYDELVARPVYNEQDPTSTNIQALPSTRLMYLVNAYCTGSNDKEEDYNQLKNRVLLLSEMTFNDLKTDLNAFLPAGIPPTDPMWPNFKYGDITSPNNCLVFNTTGIQTTNVKYCKLVFGQETTIAGPNGMPQLSLQVQRQPITPEILAGREDLAASVHVPSYDEIVELLVNERLIPYELIASVCAKKCNRMPENPALTPDVTPQEKKAEYNPAYAPVQQPMPQQQAPQPMMPQQQAPQPMMPQQMAQPAAQNMQPGTYPPVQPMPTPVMYQQPQPTTPTTTPNPLAHDPSKDHIPGLEPVAGPVAAQQPAQAPMPQQVAQTAPVAAPAASKLTPDEEAEYQRLNKIVLENPNNLKMEELTAYSNLLLKRGTQN